MTTYGYMRVSTEKQEMERQRADLLEYANKYGLHIGDNWVEEKVSSRNGERKVFSLVDRLQEGDIILTSELSRIGRSIPEIRRIISEVEQKKASIWTIDHDLRLGVGMNMIGETMLFCLGMAAQIERDLNSVRTKSGLRAAREKGSILGRPAGKSKLDKKAEEIDKLLALTVSKANIAKIVGCSRNALHVWLKRRAKA